MNIALFLLSPDGSKQLSPAVLDNTTIYTNVLDFLNSPLEFKIALFHLTMLYNKIVNNDEVTKITQQCNTVIFFENECSIDTYDYVTKYNDCKYYFNIGCFINTDVDISFKYSNYWFSSSSNFYVNIMPELLPGKYNPFLEKQFHFDVLYGTPKIHRNYMSELINGLSDDITNKLLISKFLKPDTRTNSMHNIVMNEHRDNIWEDEMIPVHGNDNVYVDYYGYRKMHPSQVIPLKIYNKTAFSIVFETYSDNEYTFFTEKTVKPIIAKRLFLMVAGQYYLRNLRKLGFKTFDGIVDESYDLEPNLERRCQMILNELIKICNQSQSIIFKKILPIVTYNYKQLGYLSSSPTYSYTQYIDEQIKLME